MGEPFTVPPSPCPQPVGAHGSIAGSLWLTLTVDAASKTFEVPVPRVVF